MHCSLGQYQYRNGCETQAKRFERILQEIQKGWQSSLCASGSILTIPAGEDIIKRAYTQRLVRKYNTLLCPTYLANCSPTSSLFCWSAKMANQSG